MGTHSSVTVTNRNKTHTVERTLDGDLLDSRFEHILTETLNGKILTIQDLAPMIGDGYVEYDDDCEGGAEYILFIDYDKKELDTHGLTINNSIILLLSKLIEKGWHVNDGNSAVR